MVSSTPRMQCEARGGSRKKWKLEHLPKGTSEVFTNHLVPLTKSLVGSLSPWEGLSKEHVQELVDKIYGSAQYTIQDAPTDPWGPLMSLVFKSPVRSSYLVANMVTETLTG